MKSKYTLSLPPLLSNRGIITKRISETLKSRHSGLSVDMNDPLNSSNQSEIKDSVSETSFK